MNWLKKKKESTAVFANTAYVSSESGSSEYAASSREICRKHISHLLENGNKNNHGYTAKLYIENFKRLNDVFGYEFCEKLLQQIIDYLYEETGSNVYRYVSVEFIMIWDGLNASSALDRAEKIINRFQKVWTVNGTDCLCSIQIGLASYPGQENADVLLRQLDLAVSKAGEYGSNQASVYDSTIQKEFERRKQIAHYLETAIERDEIEIRYRPTYNIQTKRFSRADCYMRVFIQGLGMIGANEVVSIAEDSGQIRKLEYYVLEQACSCIETLKNAGKEFDSVSVPISPILLLQESFIPTVREMLERHRIPKGKLGIEIQENALTTAFLNINVRLQELSDLNVEIILNNFGSGYSGISSILSLPINTLKLERLFVWQLETNPKSAHIIRGLVTIANNLGLNIIAEGVETKNQFQLLGEFQCALQQGFYYSPTLDVDVLTSVIGEDLNSSIKILDAEKEKVKKY